MKAQIKYAFRTGLFLRVSAFGLITLMNITFITLGSLGLLPFAAHITAVSLGGTAIAVMLAINIVCNVSIASHMFSAPAAYMFALTPSPRWKLLLSSVISMLAADFVTMGGVIIGEVILSFNLAGNDITNTVWNAFVSMNASAILYSLLMILLMLACYLFFIMVILFGVTLNKSILYKKPVSGLLALISACVCVYIGSLLNLALAPFGSIFTYGMFIVISVGLPGLALSVLLYILQTAALFVITSKLMERKINI